MLKLDQVFQRKKPLIVYITAGDPDLKKTEQTIYALEKAGVDIIELGVPFSDPLADGLVIQASHKRALKNRTNLKDIIELIKRVREKTSIPLVLMGSYNLFYNFGLEKLSKAAKEHTIDGLIIPDLPPEEAFDIHRLAAKNNFALIFLAALTSSHTRLKKIASASSGFIYFVAVKGTTGSRATLDKQLLQKVAALKKITSKPIAVGFGIAKPEQAKKILKTADGIIIGSKFIVKYQESAKKGLAFIKQFIVTKK
jgi:tryptophan synthase alpha chain